jgi:Tol biopolymer transport system component/DNA-binding winged helix-turn-helix (wHTH) protein
MMAPETAVIYSFGDLTADPKLLEMRRNGAPLDLEPKALRVFFHLLENRGRVVTKEELMAEAWSGTFVTDNALTRVIAQIRKQLGDSARAPRYIETVATTGYRFIAEVQVSGKPPAAAIADNRRWRAAVAIACLAAASTAVWWWVTRPRALEPVRILGLRQLTSAAAADLWPSFSPDGSQLAFSSNRTGHFEIYIRSRAAGGSERQITFDGQENLQPVWSPDGQYLAYTSRLRGGIAVIPVSGGPARYLTDSGDSPQWSPDGRTIAYRWAVMNAVLENYGQDDSNLMLVDLDGSAPRPLTRRGTPHGGHNDPQWLADGRHVLFVNNKGMLARREAPKIPDQPWLVDVVTGELHGISLPMASVRFPVFSKDSYLYFVGQGIEHASGVWRVRVDRNWKAGAPELLMAAAGASPVNLALTADGAHLALSQNLGESAIWSAPLAGSGVAAGEPRPLLRDHSLRNTSPVFSADGSKISYESVRQGGEWIVFTANADGSSAAPLTPAGQNSGMASWFGNEMKCLYGVRQKGQSTYWLAPPSGPPVRLDLKLGVRQVDRLRVSRDGTKVVAHELSAGGYRVMTEEIATGVVRELTPEGRSIGYPCWSPDGKWIAAEEQQHGRSSVVVFPAAGGEIRTVVNDAVHSWPHDWAPDSDRIVFAGQRGGVWNIYWVSRSTGRVEQVTRFTSQASFDRYPSWSPRGDQIVFEHNDLTANVYVADLR